MKLEALIYKYRWPISTMLLGLIIFCIGLFTSEYKTESELVIIEDPQETIQQSSQLIVVEISGAVAKPGVYEVPSDSRIDDLIEQAGGLENENIEWVERFINRASKMSDGQKIFIPSNHSDVESDSNYSGSSQSLGSSDSYININTASQSELESMWGIGPVYAQKIIDHRPYSDVSELTEKDIIKQNVFDKNKEKMTVY